MLACLPGPIREEFASGKEKWKRSELNKAVKKAAVLDVAVGQNQW